ncbi:MAG: ABC transporter ATP-binding protein [Raoultibacter sp.]|jgi:putative ABC transport system ATP-binding protein
MEKIITGENIVKSFGEGQEKNLVLNGVSVEIGQGEFVSVMGPSGSGKTTLMFALSGMDTIDSGKVSHLTERAKRLMKKVGIEGLENRDITQVSGGQLQRAGICRALMGDPQIIFGDEPTGALNSKSAQEIMDILAMITAKGTAILLVTHDAEVAAQTGRVLFMRDGKIVDEMLMKDVAGQSLEQKVAAVTQKMQEIEI